MTATHHEVMQAQDSYTLREPVADYEGDFDHKIVPLSTTNRFYWDINVEASDG